MVTEAETKLKRWIVTVARLLTCCIQNQKQNGTNQYFKLFERFSRILTT